MATIADFVRDRSQLGGGNTVSDLIQNPQLCSSSELIEEGVVTPAGNLAPDTGPVSGAISSSTEPSAGSIGSASPPSSGTIDPA